MAWGTQFMVYDNQASPNIPQRRQVISRGPPIMCPLWSITSMIPTASFFSSSPVPTSFLEEYQRAPFADMRRRSWYQYRSGRLRWYAGLGLRKAGAQSRMARLRSKALNQGRSQCKALTTAKLQAFGNEKICDDVLGVKDNCVLCRMKRKAAT
jgi:hypothetical protein